MLKDDRNPRALAALPDEALLDTVQRQTFRYFWEGAHPASGLAFDRRTSPAPSDRRRRQGRDRWLGLRRHGADRRRGARLGDARRSSRSPAAACSTLAPRPRYHGAFPHFMNGATRRDDPFWRKDDAARSRRDLVPVDGPAVRAPVFRPRTRRGEPAAQRASRRSGTTSSGTGSRRAGARSCTGTGARTTAGR